MENLMSFETIRLEYSREFEFDEGTHFSSFKFVLVSRRLHKEPITTVESFTENVDKHVGIGAGKLSVPSEDLHVVIDNCESKRIERISFRKRSAFKLHDNKYSSVSCNCMK